MRTIVAFLYAPGAWVTRIPVPDAAHVAAIRAPASENAAPWLHLMAATLACVVIVPRLALALATAGLERYRARHLLDDVADPYFQRLLRGFHQGPLTVDVVPYSYAAAPAGGRLARSAARPRARRQRRRGARAGRRVRRRGRRRCPRRRARRARLRVALFNATATPEREAHGRFLATLARSGGTWVALVDEARSTRAVDDAERRETRRALWRDVAGASGIAPRVRRPRGAGPARRRARARRGARRRGGMSATGSQASATITLSLVSHTNAGKTTLARTLLARDVGEVRDAPHVTTEATAYPLVETDDGDRLLLWDTPGFGDSARLARRLAQEGNPIGWFLAQVWDRFRDRPFWLTQQAVRTVREHTDVVLYLVNASEDPGDAGYLEPELAVLAWMGKPVLVLLNQTGPPRTRDAQDDEAARVARGARRPRARARRARLRRVRALLGAGVRAVRGHRAAAAGDARRPRTRGWSTTGACGASRSSTPP